MLRKVMQFTLGDPSLWKERSTRGGIYRALEVGFGGLTFVSMMCITVSSWMVVPTIMLFALIMRRHYVNTKQNAR